MVNSKNQWTFTNNSNLCEVAKVPLSFPSPPDKGDLGGWLCIGSISLILRLTIKLVCIGCKILSRMKLSQVITTSFCLFCANRREESQLMKCLLIRIIKDISIPVNQRAVEKRIDP